MSKSVATLEDNMIMMGRYGDGFFDLACVDPPYGIGINMNMGRRKGVSAVHTKKNWDSGIPDEKYFKELRRVSKNQIIWGGNYFPLPLTKSWIFWDKNVPEGVDFADGELAWTSYDKTLIKARVVYTGFQGMDNGGKIHPTQKPVALYYWIFKKYCQPGFKILDTHLGSGSSRIAAHYLGFDFYGCDNDPEYFTGQEQRFLKSIGKEYKISGNNFTKQSLF